MGFWHPGMHGVYDHKSLAIPKFEPSPTLFTCEICHRNFLDIEKLRRHKFEQHPLRQPTLLLHGRPVGGTPLNGMMYYDSGANCAKMYGNSSWHLLW